MHSLDRTWILFTDIKKALIYILDKQNTNLKENTWGASS